MHEPSTRGCDVFFRDQNGNTLGRCVVDLDMDRIRPISVQRLTNGEGLIVDLELIDDTEEER